MKHTVLTSLSLMAAFALATQAQADERWPRWYIGLHGSLNYLQDADLSGAGTSDMEFDQGYGFGASIGYMPNFAGEGLNRMRFELEASRRQNDVDNVTTTGGTTSAGGDITGDFYMVNALYDFASGGSRWTPYIGAGIGWGDMELDSTSTLLTVDSDDSVFAYQGMLGIAYVPQNIPMTEWNLGYRYVGTEDPSFATAGGSVEAEYNSHNVEAGAKFRF